MRVTNARVTSTSTYRNMTTSVNNVHLALNKSMNKISSGEKYETAADSPLSYYRGQKIDSNYQDILSKSSLLKDVQNRIYQQELGARDIKTIIGGAGGAKTQVQYARTATTVDYAMESTRQDLLQKAQAIVNDLNMQYEDYYIYGGNDISAHDISTPPFALSADGRTFTYRHTFPGETDRTEFVMKYVEKADGSGFYEFKLDTANGATPDKLLQALREQSRIDIGYGTIQDRSTLLDTFTGGMNILTGISSDAALASKDSTDPTSLEANPSLILEKLSKGPLGMVAQAALAIEDYQQVSPEPADLKEAAEAKLDSVLGSTIEGMTLAERSVSSMYADLGNKYSLIDDMQERFSTLKVTMESQYKDILGADQYESVLEMFNNRSSYNAALQVSSKLMSSSLFDFVR